MTARRLHHNTTKTPDLTAGRDRPVPACAGNWLPFYNLIDHPGNIYARKTCLDICKRCPIRDTCWDEHAEEEWVQALENPATPKPAGRPRSPIPHGTNNGWTTHRKRGETPCEECRDARATYLRELRNRRSGDAA